jgi:1,4-alpha-glucan branching enzyme
MPTVDFSIFLHTHMPYVRRNGDWPCGEQWILEAWAESYLPIWSLVEDLTSGDLPGKLALTLVPVLAEQLQDEYLQERLAAYLKNRIRQAGEEIERLKGMGDEPRAALAALHRDRLSQLSEQFEGRWKGRMLEVLKEGMDSGRVEILTSAATHSHLPSLGSAACRRAQIKLGLESYRRYFQRDPCGLWIPECSYMPELDEVLEEFSPPLRYVILDFGAVESSPENAHTWEPRRLGSTSLLVLTRDLVAHDLVWTIEGIPSHPYYRDYAKRDEDGYGHGFHYWRITSLTTPLDHKDIYYPQKAHEQAREDARIFVSGVRKRKGHIQELLGSQDSPAVILAGYDTELLGHWWLEGPLWLREVLLLLHEDMELPCDVAQKALLGDVPTLSPSLTTWSLEGDFTTWVNPSTTAIWERVHRAEEDFLARIHSVSEKTPEEERILRQAARELLLIEASDWTYMITRERAEDYARERVSIHLDRLYHLLQMLEQGEIDTTLLDELEETDNIFPHLDLAYWR